MNTKNILLTLILIVLLLAAGWFFFAGSQEATAPTGDETPATTTPNGDVGGEPEETITVDLYYYNADNDTDQNGNIQCSPQGLVAVEREIPVTQTPIQDTIRLLLKGELTQAEEARGIETEYPLPGFTLEGANLQDGVLTLEFDDSQGQSNGGSCRTAILWFQIAETAKQFEAVGEVTFQPEELFQP